MYIEIIWLIVGLVALWFGADVVIKAAVRIAKSMGISEAFIGLTILSIGTSLPELFAHIVASIEILGKGDGVLSGVVFGTNIGSNIAQITLILGLVGFLITIKSEEKTMRRDFLIMIGATLLLLFMSLNGFISRIEGGILVLLYLGYLFYLGKEEKKKAKKHEKTNVWFEILLLMFGFVLLLGGAKYVVDNAVIISNVMGWSGTFIGAIIIGLGTSLPELSTALMSVIKGRHSMSVGTLIGSNITNPLFALGIGAIISGYIVDKSLIFFDMPFFLVVSVIALGFMWNDMKLSRKEAAVLLLFYLAYLFIRMKFLIN